MLNSGRYFIISPNGFSIFGSGFVDVVQDISNSLGHSWNSGVRPVISLRSDSLVTEGDGSYETPYVVGPIVTRDNINYNY